MCDAAIGDPRSWPHPVRLMGRLIAWFEECARPICRTPRNLRWAGIVLAVALPLVSYTAGWLLILCATSMHDWIGKGVGIILAAATLAWRDLMDHVRVVARALTAGVLPQARQAASRIVGRDTETFTEAETVRATVETIAESASDGVIAPLLYLLLGGAPLALAYKAVSTLDSMVGHRDERYRDFGWASARLDDAVNWIPARVTAGLFVLASWPVFRRLDKTRQAWAMLLRDGMKHPSPNSGRPEAAMAGALGVQLGGASRYDGVASVRPHLGDAREPLAPCHIAQAQMMMTTAYLLAIVCSVVWLWL